MAAPAPAQPSSWARTASVVLLLTAIISVLMIAFALPSTRSSVHDVPIAVAGPSQATAQVAAQLAAQRPGAFTITTLPGTAAAEAAIRDREVYGAIDLSTGSPQVLTASAGSPVIAQTLQQLAQSLRPATGASPAVPVRDIVALPADDPRGAGLAAGALPLVLGGILAAALLSSLVIGTSRRLTGALAFSVTGGLALAAILQFWLGSIDGDYWANSAAVALSIAATAGTILGLETLLGTTGLALGSATMMLLGNPLSGLSTAPEMLPGDWGTLGQLLPPGAAASLLRSTAFFDGGGARPHVTVLLCWVALGVVLNVAGTAVARRRTTNPADVRAPQGTPATV